MSLDLSIVDTVLGSYLKGKNLKAKIDAQKAGQQFRQQQLAQQQQEFEENLKLHTDQFKAKQQQDQANFGLAAATARAQAKQIALESGQGTVGRDEEGNDTLDIPSPVAGEPNLVANVTQFTNARTAAAQRAAQQAGLVEGAKSDATTPGKIKVVQATGEEARKTEAQKSGEAVAEAARARTFKAGESKLDRASKEHIAQLTGQFHIQGIQLGKSIDDSETTANYAGDVLDLTTPLQTIPIKHRDAVNNTLRRNGFVAPDKDLPAKLDAFKGLSEVFATGAELTDKLAKDKLGAVGQRITAASGLTDLAKKREELQARAGAIVKSPIFASDKGNIALKEVDRALNAFGRGGNTFAEGVERFADVQRAVHGAIDYALKKYPEAQQHLYKAKLPKELLQEVNVKDSLKAGHLVFDFDDGTPEPGASQGAPQPSVTPSIPVGR